MSAVESTLAGLLFKATLALAAAVAARFVLRRASAATRHLVLALAMLGLVLLPVFVLGLPAWRLELLAPGTSAARPTVPPPAAVGDKPQPLPIRATEKIDSPAVADGPARAAAIAGRGTPESASGWLGAAWLVGCVLMLAKLAAGLARMRSIVRRGRRVTDPSALRLLDECVNTLGLRVRPLLVTAAQVDVPLVWGWLRPALIVPRAFAGWTPDAVRAVVLHELGHLKRVDWPVLLLGRVVVALYWFHPLVWLVERWAKQECERACDDIVVGCGTKPSDYASHLLSIARGLPRAPASAKAALAVVRRSHMNVRLRSILDPLLSRRAPSRSAVGGLSTLLLLLLVPLASVQLAARADEPEADTEVLLAQHEAECEDAEHGGNPEVSEAKRAYEQGYELHGKGRHDEAARSFERAAELGFRSGTAMYNVACCHALMGDAGEAIDWLERAIEAGFDDPRNVVKDSDFDPIRTDAGFQSFVDRAFADAGLERRDPEHYALRAFTEKFHELKETGSTNAKKWHAVGYRLLMMGRVDLATDAFSEAVEHAGKNNSTAMYNLACCHSRAGRTGAALDWLDRAVEAGLDQQEHLANDPDLDPVRGRPEFERILNKSEFLSLKRFVKDRGEMESPERWRGAVDEFRAYVREHGSSGRGWFNLGWALHHSERYDEAVEAFAEAASLGFRPTISTYNVACANARLGRTDAALDALERAVESGMKNPWQLREDDDLASLRDEPRFRALVARLEELHEAEHDEHEKQKQLEKEKRMKAAAESGRRHAGGA